MPWTSIEERTAPKPLFNASVRLLSRGKTKPILLVSLKSSVSADLKWTAKDGFILQLGTGDMAGKLRIERRKTGKIVTRPRVMKTGAMAFDFGYIAALGDVGSAKCDATAQILDADSVEVVLPDFAANPVVQDDEEEADDSEESDDEADGETVPQRQPRAKRVEILNGIRIDLKPDDESVTYSGRCMDVTRRQAALMVVLARAFNRIVDRTFIANTVFSDVQTHLRDVVLDQTYPDLVRGLPGIGLKLTASKIGLALSDR